MGFANVASAESIQSNVLQSSGSEMYFFNGQTRFWFPNWDVYRSWSDVVDPTQSVSSETMNKIVFGSPVTVRPGLPVKFSSSPIVYVVESPKTLRAIPNETIAAQEWGAGWQGMIVSQPDDRKNDYHMGANVESADGLLLYQRMAGTTSPADVVGYQSIDTFLHPSASNVLSVGIREYTIQSLLTPEQIQDWLNKMSPTFTLLYSRAGAKQENVWYPKGTQQNITAMTYGMSTGDTFMHRSVLVSTTSGSPTSTMRYMDIAYPSGYLVYPRAATMSFAANGVTANQNLLTFDEPKDVVAWYKARAPRYGWKIVRLDAVGEAGNGVTTMTLVRINDQKTKLAVTVFDGAQKLIVQYFDTSGRLSF
jgi:hypothetical protein